MNAASQKSCFENNTSHVTEAGINVSDLEVNRQQMNNMNLGSSLIPGFSLLRRHSFLTGELCHSSAAELTFSSLRDVQYCEVRLMTQPKVAL